VKDPYLVLHEKECEAARVRNEIAVLLTIIPLLSDDSFADVNQAAVHSRRDSRDADDASMAELKRYYPFIRYLIR
jgi:hypothetical protein